MIEDKKRIHMLDEIRGFAIICMIVHHTFLDVGDVLGLAWGYKVFDALCVVQPIFWAAFIVISGICSRLSRNTVKRGAIVLTGGAVITLVTAVIMPFLGFTGAEIYFGILHCLGVCMMITGLLIPLFKKFDYRAGAAVSLLLFLFFCGLESRKLCFGFITLPDKLYSYNAFAALGFHSNTFHSADYFPVLPWIFVFIFGFFIGKLAEDEKLPKPMYEKHSKFLSAVGRNSLWIYLAHQPIIYIIMMLISILI